MAYRDSSGKPGLRCVAPLALPSSREGQARLSFLIPTIRWDTMSFLWGVSHAAA